ncbi:MAG: cation:proton antiporter [Oscillospiraceae bacterium]|nr:cation:proton antiporter [Oscillospiraceae bacterium]
MLTVSDSASLLLIIGFAMFAGLLITRVVKPFGLPAVTAYLISGLLISPCLLGRFGFGFTSFEAVGQLSIISDVALGFIAFSIGNEFKLEELKHTGKQAAVVGVLQALTAMVLVDALLLGAYYVFDLGEKIGPAACITLGAVATATAPAATLMVINQYKAKGPLTSILLPIVALDDAVGLVVFSVSLGIAKSLHAGEAMDVIAVLVNPLLEVVCSLLLGSIMGVIFTWIEKLFHSNTKRICLSITFVFFTVALSMIRIEIPGSRISIGFSSLLVCMMLGTVFCNICSFADDIMVRIDRWTSPLFLLFFVISGAELDLRVFSDLTIVLVGLLYIVARSAGKYFGASFSARATKCPPTVCKYLGITLLPQAGVALGMSVKAAAELGSEGAIVRSIALFAVLIYELVGPALTKMALTRAGEITTKQEGQDRSRFQNVSRKG